MERGEDEWESRRELGGREEVEILSIIYKVKTLIIVSYEVMMIGIHLSPHENYSPMLPPFEMPAVEHIKIMVCLGGRVVVKNLSSYVILPTILYSIVHKFLLSIAVRIRQLPNTTKPPNLITYLVDSKPYSYSLFHILPTYISYGSK